MHFSPPVLKEQKLETIFGAHANRKISFCNRFMQCGFSLVQIKLLYQIHCVKMRG
jgi:hypothetical protein